MRINQIMQKRKPLEIIRIAAAVHMERALTNHYPGTIRSLYKTGCKLLDIKNRPMSSRDRAKFTQFLRSRGWDMADNKDIGPATWHCPNPRPLKRKKRKRIRKTKPVTDND